MPDPVLRRDAFLQRLGGRRAAAAALADGSWRRVLRGTYAPAGAELDLELKCRAAQLLLPEHARVADRCLLWLLGVDVLPPGPPVLEVVVPRGAVVPRRSWVRARTGDIRFGTGPGSARAGCGACDRRGRARTCCAACPR